MIAHVPSSSKHLAATQIRARLQPWRLCLFFGLVGALSMAVLTPPFQVPDEPQHFFRAYQLSEGRLETTVRQGKAGALLPASLPALVETFLGTRALHAPRPVRAQPLDVDLERLQRPLDPGRVEFVDFSGAAIYWPAPYVPQALAMAIGRSMGAGPLGLLYLGRLANALAAIVLLAWSIRMLPVGRRPALLFGLLPMAVFLYGSLSPDALVIATTFLFVAVIARGIVHARWGVLDALAGTLAALVFCALKPVYAPLLLLGLPAALRAGQGRRALAFHGAVVGTVLGVTLLWTRHVSALLILPKENTSVAGQLAFIAGDPAQYARVLYWTVLTQWHTLYDELVGVLGWLTVRLPSLAYLLPLLGVLLCVPASIGSRQRLPWTAVCWSALLVLASATLVMTALYLYWVPVGESAVSGLQGRYFLPLLAALAPALGSILRAPAPVRLAIVADATLALVIAASVLTAQATVVHAYQRLG